MQWCRPGVMAVQLSGPKAYQQRGMFGSGIYKGGKKHARHGWSCLSCLAAVRSTRSPITRRSVRVILGVCKPRAGWCRVHMFNFQCFKTCDRKKP